MSITLEQLIALNDEIAALVRVGVPLEHGLRHLGSDLPGRTGQLAQRMAERLEKGESLSELFAQDPRSFPPVYQAVVNAGLKTGRLAVALESLAGTARRLAEARRIVATGLIYPLLVFFLTWALFVVFVLTVAPALALMFADLRLPGHRFFDCIASWGGSAVLWGYAVPAAVLLLAGIWAFFSARAMAIEPRFSGLLLSWLPWTRRMLYSFRVAMFSEVLALLVQHRVPLDVGLELAGESVGNPKMLRALRAMAEAIRAGQPLADITHSEFPPLLQWLMSTGQAHSGLLPALRHAAETYHRRARYQADAARKLVPIVLTLAIGGGVSAAYALLVFGSWGVLLKSLAQY